MIARLCFVLFPCALLLAACERRPAPTPAPAVPLEEFCHVYATGNEAKTFRYPDLVEPHVVGDTWQWINVWATWCTPCVAEMPMLEQWQRRLASGGQHVELVFLSVDEDVDALSRFRAKHRRGEGPRVRAMDSMGPWLQHLGLAPTAAVPIHVWVDPRQKVRCVRTGALSEHHFDTVARLVGTERR